MKNLVPRLLIISGGSEVVSLALADAAYSAVLPYAVFSLVPNSVLKGAAGSVSFVDLSAKIGCWDQLRHAFLLELSLLPQCSSRLAILPTEDGSLRLLNECRDEVLEWGEFPRARNLRMGGLDKAEVVEFAQSKGVSHTLAPTKVLYRPEDAVAVLLEFGVDTVFKPALKPLSMDLSVMGGQGIKVVTQNSVEEGAESIIARLRKAWPLSERWIAQPRFYIGAGLERSVCAVRGSSIRACQVVERGKFPRMGGTAYWVSTENKTDLIASASCLLEALDMIGMCELSYLPDKAYRGQLIELNPRPWLQVSLVERAGFSIITEAISVLQGEMSIPSMPVLAHCDWLQPERMFLSLLSRESTLPEFSKMVPLAFRSTSVIGGYESFLPGMRRKMFARTLRKFLQMIR
ncbi:MAG: hypothetical protein WCY88_05465 [Spongiibacteraceae bacterium]